MGIYVLDVSSWQSVDAVKNPNVQGVIVKATQGTTYVNPKCNSQWDTAVKAGKLVGLYHYATGADPVQEANHFINSISNYVGKGILALDWESAENKAWGSKVWAKRFIDKVHDLTGVWCLLYTGSEGVKQCANVAATSGLWYANYPSGHNSKNEPWSVPGFNINISPWPTYTIWQWSSKGGTLDMNYAQLTEDGWKLLANPNLKKQQEQPSKSTSNSGSALSYSTKGKSLQQIASDVNKGLLGAGQYRENLLGNLYNSVQAVVNYDLKELSKSSLIRVLGNEVKKGYLGVGDTRKAYLGEFYNDVQSSINSSVNVHYYTVQSGDTLSAIGLKLGINWVTLAANNGIKAPYLIRVGQRIRY